MAPTVLALRDRNVPGGPGDSGGTVSPPQGRLGTGPATGPLHTFMALLEFFQALPPSFLVLLKKAHPESASQPVVRQVDVMCASTFKHSDRRWKKMQKNVFRLSGGK